MRRLLLISCAILSIIMEPVSAHDNSSEKHLQQQLDAAHQEIADLRQIVEEIKQQVTIGSKSITTDNLNERVEELEIIALDLDDSVGDKTVVGAFDAVQFNLGGFLDTTSTIVIGEDNTTVAPNKQVFELLAHAQLREKWDAFFAQAFARNAPLSFTDPDGVRSPQFQNNNSPVVTDTVIAWGQYAHSDIFNVQFGRYITPVGIINVEHFPATLLDTAQPMFLRPFPGQTLFANFTNGINLHGSKFIGANKQNKVEYSLYGGAWSGNTTALSLGGRARYTLSDYGLSIGVNAYTGDRSNVIDNDRFIVTGADILYTLDRFTLKTEAFYSFENLGDDRLAFYIQPSFQISPKLTGFYRYDYFDQGRSEQETTEQVLGLVYNPVTNIRLRTLYRHKSFSDVTGAIEASTDSFQLSTTLNF